ncbi:MAG: hypothetical protein ACQKBV_08860 [Puniceicoccales bacterium]
MLTLLAVTAVFAGAAFAQNSPNQNIVRIKDTGTPSVQSINAKLDRLIQQQGGRYVFLSSADGDLWRLDTFTGKVAVLNLVRGAEWDTLDVPEKSVGPGNAFYEQYVQKLNGINFNSN